MRNILHRELSLHNFINITQPYRPISFQLLEKNRSAVVNRTLSKDCLKKWPLDGAGNAFLLVIRRQTQSKRGVNLKRTTPRNKDR